MVQILATGAPQTFFYYNKLQFSELTTNRAVGSSNLSGRAKKDKGSPLGALFLFQLRITFELRSSIRGTRSVPTGGAAQRRRGSVAAVQSLRARHLKQRVSRFSRLALFLFPTLFRHFFSVLMNQHQIWRFGPATTHNRFGSIDELVEFCSRVMSRDVAVGMTK